MRLGTVRSQHGENEQRLGYAVASLPRLSLCWLSYLPGATLLFDQA
jgi:hypothetical protein